MDRSEDFHRIWMTPIVLAPEVARDAILVAHEKPLFLPGTHSIHRQSRLSSESGVVRNKS